MAQRASLGTEKGLFHAFRCKPEEGRKKTTYYVRGKRGLQVAPFPPLTYSDPKRSTPQRKLTAMDRITITLPYPPSVNHYWRTRVLRHGNRHMPSIYVSQEGQRYQQEVARILDGVPRFSGRLRVQILVKASDGRSRDLDNVLKCLLDSLTKAGVWNDDSQVDSLLIVRGEQTTGGAVIVIVEETSP